MKFCSIVLFSVLEEKQKSDAEEDGGTGSQDEEERKPTAEVRRLAHQSLSHLSSVDVY